MEVQFSPDLEGTLKRVPVQRRSRERLVAILEAADEVLATDGAGGFTMARVAQVAGVPVGSIYHLFEDKDGLVDALAVNAWGTLVDRIKRAISDVTALSADDAIGVGIRAVRDGFRDARGFRVLWYSPLRTQRVRDVTRPARDAFQTLTEGMLAELWPRAAAADRASAAGVAVLIGDGMLREAFRLDPAGDDAILREWHTAVVAYLRARLGEPR
jgi:AcrR family transcriptional regulator